MPCTLFRPTRRRSLFGRTPSQFCACVRARSSASRRRRSRSSVSSPPDRRWTEVIDVRAINAVTGPVFIEGVMPGDAVSVEVLAIEPRDWAWNAAIPGFGLLDGLLPEPMLERLPIRDGEVIVSERVRLPVRPMIGCLGLAPAEGETSTLSPAMPWAGNYDLTQIAPGATVLFPAQVPGGLFSLGDLHAAMGEHEADVRCHRVRWLGDRAARRATGHGPGNAAHRDRGPHLRHRSERVRRLRRGEAPGRAPPLRAAHPRGGALAAGGVRRSCRPAAISPSAARPGRSSWAACRG